MPGFVLLTLVSLCFQGGADQKMPIIVSRVAPGTSVSPHMSRESVDEEHIILAYNRTIR